jgi:glycyl-tRNA synthetase beta subunit
MPINNPALAGTVAHPLSDTNDLTLKGINFTCSIGVNEQCLYNKILGLITVIERKEQIIETEIYEIENLIAYLPEGSKERLELSFLLSIQKRKLGETIQSKHNSNVRMSSLLEAIKNVDCMEELDEFLIENGYEDYVNLGIDGRKKVIFEIFNERDKYLTNEHVENALLSKVEHINKLLQTINNTEDFVELLNSLTELRLDYFLDLDTDCQVKVVEKLLKLKNRRFSNLTALKVTIEKICEDIQNVMTSLTVSELMSMK